MLKIKLAPTGKKNDIHYRIVVAEEHSKLTGRYKELLGHYHPLQKILKFNRESVAKWLSQGAQPTQRIRKLLKLK